MFGTAVESESSAGASKAGQLSDDPNPEGEATKNPTKMPEPEQQQQQQQPTTQPIDRHVPWQLEWKHPRWISSRSPPSTSESNRESSSSSSSSNSNSRDDIVGVTTAQLSDTEISYILGFDDPETHKGQAQEQAQGANEDHPGSSLRNDCHYLLSVTLLGWWSPRAIPLAGHPDDGNGNGNGPTGTTLAATSSDVAVATSLASEVLIEVIEVPTSTTATATATTTTTATATTTARLGSNEETTENPATGANIDPAVGVIRSKRLRWPESIFNDSTANANAAVAVRTDSSDSNSSNKPRSTTAAKKQKPKKNFFASVFLPLMGIDEEDKYDPLRRSSISSSDDAVGAPDPRPRETKPRETEPPPTHGIVSATLCRPPANDAVSVSATKEILGLMSFGDGAKEPTRGVEPSRSKGDGDEPSRTEERQNPHSAGQSFGPSPTTVDGALSFACVSTRGEVFVYDPIKLLLGIDDDSGLTKDAKEAKKGLEEATSFFFGDDLFRNLQETWKPLAEPSTRIHLSLFQHDHDHQRQHQQQQQSKTRPLDKLVHSNQQISELTQSVLSRAGGERSGQHHRHRHRHRHRHPGRGSRHSGRQRHGRHSAPSMSSDDDDAVSVLTSATDALSAVQESALEFQSRVDDTFSMISYLFNPLLEPATLKDRTVRNQPLEMTVAGASCVVVIGTGLRTKAAKQLGGAARSSSSTGSVVRSPASSVPTKDRSVDGDGDGNSDSDFATFQPSGTGGVPSPATSPKQKSLPGLEERPAVRGVSSLEGPRVRGGESSSPESEKTSDRDTDGPINPFVDSTEEGNNDDCDNADITDLEQTSNNPNAQEELHPNTSSSTPFAKDNLHPRDGDVAEKPPGTNPFSDDEHDVGDDDVFTHNKSSRNSFDGNVDHANTNAQVNGTSSDPYPSWLEEPGDGEAKETAVTDETDADKIRDDTVPSWEKSSDDGNNDGDEASSSSSAQSGQEDGMETQKVCKNGAEEVKEGEDNSQRHYFYGYDEVFEEHNSRDRGGFVTFLSTACWSETRTLFIPFVPIRVSHISQWNGMELLWVIGDFESLLIRMDSTGPVAVSIRDVLRMEKTNEETDFFQTSTAVNHGAVTGEFEHANELSPLSVKKFQILPIDPAVPNHSVSPRLLCASSTGIDPPCILELYVDSDDHPDRPNFTSDAPDALKQNWHQMQHSQQGLVLLKTLGYCTPQGTVVLRHVPSHVAKIIIDQSPMILTEGEPHAEESFVGETSLWAEQGQGWSLIGINRHSYFICWEGSTLLQGAHVQKFNDTFPQTAYTNIFATHVLLLPRIREVSAEKSSSSHFSFNPTADAAMDLVDRKSERDQVSSTHQRFSSAVLELPSINDFQPSQLSKTEHDEQYGSAFSSAVNDFTGTITNSLGSTISSRRQYSEYLLQQCSSWTQLEDTLDDRIMLERQEPVLCIRSGSAGSLHNVLTLRQLVVENGTSSPFQQVLAWLAKRKNFFVAAGVALDLLKDADSLYHLWKHAEMIDEEDEETKLFGLLDGITPVLLDDGNHIAKECNQSVTATHLSEMTVGCLIKGGASMAKTLVRFLESNKLYDPTRVSLMLSLTTINLLSVDAIANKFRTVKDKELDFNQWLWPIECLLAIGTERDYLSEVLTLLNNAIPDELRHRKRGEEEKIEHNISTSTMGFTKKLIQLILESDAVAIEILMSFVDDRSQATFWQSIDHKTSLGLALMKIDSSFPFLKQPEVRSWMREELDNYINELPTVWLQELTYACLENAGCDLNALKIEYDNEDQFLTSSSKLDGSERTQRRNNLSLSSVTSDLGEADSSTYVDDSVEKLNAAIQKTRNALLVTNDGISGLDYDLLIPTLLMLEKRRAHWFPPSLASQSRFSSQESSTCSTTMNEELFTSTQELVNAACYLAGRAPMSGYGGEGASRDNSEDESLLFVSFDSKSAMKQCFKAKNVVAGAYLVGGTNGFILHVCDILNTRTGMSIADAESYLISDRLDLNVVEESKAEQSPFELTAGHKKLLLLLDEHVLRIKTFGDFDSALNRGKVDPVFAARSILRAWLLLTFGDEATASKWLADWLGERLGIPGYRSSLSSSSSPYDITPRSKTGGNFSSFDTPTDTEDRIDLNGDGEITASRSPSIHRLACASLAQSLMWPQNKPAVTQNDRANRDDARSDGVADVLPLADTMKFDKKLLLELCQSCLGLVESVPPEVVRRLDWAAG